MTGENLGRGRLKENLKPELALKTGRWIFYTEQINATDACISTRH
jgi:hypothetical protein